MPKWMAEHRFCLGGNPGTACAATHPAISLFGATGRHRCLMSKCQSRRVKIWSQAVTRPDQIQGAGLSTARLIAAPKQDGATVSGDKLDRCLDAPIARAEKRLEAHRATRAAPPNPWESGSDVSRLAGMARCHVPATLPAGRRAPKHRLVLKPITLMTMAVRTGRICGKSASRLICRSGLAAIRRASASRL